MMLTVTGIACLPGVIPALVHIGFMIPVSFYGIDAHLPLVAAQHMISQSDVGFKPANNQMLHLSFILC
jgi:hypothetical protein